MSDEILITLLWVLVVLMVIGWPRARASRLQASPHTSSRLPDDTDLEEPNARTPVFLRSRLRAAPTRGDTPPSGLQHPSEAGPFHYHGTDGEIADQVLRAAGYPDDSEPRGSRRDW